MSLRNKTIQGFGWSFADNIINQGLRFVVGLVLARLVTPHDYGLIGIGVILAYIFESVVDGGFTSALIQKKQPTKEDYGTAFLSNLSMSLVIYIAVFFLAPYISLFFNNEPQITPLVRVLTSLLVIDALMLVPRARLTKEMNFKIQTKVSLIASVVAGIAGISMAFAGLGVWALAGQQIARHSCNTCLLWLVSHKQNHLFVFSTDSFKSLFSYGSKLFLTDFISAVYGQLYQLTIGKFYSPVVLGQYTRAYQFCEVFSVTFSHIVQKVSFPAMASIQDEASKLREGYRALVRYAMFIDCICMLCLAAVARPMILVLIGEQWLEAVPYLQILCLSMILYPLQAINMNILKVKGKSDLVLRLSIISRCIGIVPVLLGIFLNIYWMLIGCVFTEIICYCLNGYYSGRLIDYLPGNQMRDIIPSFLVSLTVAFFLYAMTFSGMSDYLLLPLQLLAGGIMIILLSELVHLDSYLGMKTILLSYLKQYSHDDSSRDASI